MSVRPFDWRDLPALHRYRNQCLFLDSTRLLTQGPTLIPAGALFSYLAMAMGIFTFQSVTNGGSEKVVLLGQVVHPTGAACARLSFLTPASAVESASLPELVEHLTAAIGPRGATHLLAEVDEQDTAYESMRKAGFATYARQRIWQLPAEPAGSDEEALTWQAGKSKDVINVRTLYCNLVPGLVQQVEPPPVNRLRGLVFRQEDDLQGYVEIKYGPAGIWVQPFIHPDMEKVAERLVVLLKNLPYRRSRPVYLCVRSYQSWLESALEDLGAEAGPRQAVMVRHLAMAQKTARAYMIHALERGHPEVTAPIIRRILRKL
ncbi:MAG: hypothetical protein EHM70_06815 [Chloroflexota bacterium]|nr:MAG: hypothetical protein EHM70_06815 [Chloroflexota bacterium]